MLTNTRLLSLKSISLTCSILAPNTALSLSLWKGESCCDCLVPASTTVFALLQITYVPHAMHLNNDLMIRSMIWVYMNGACMYTFVWKYIQYQLEDLQCCDSLTILCYMNNYCITQLKAFWQWLALLYFKRKKLFFSTDLLYDLFRVFDIKQLTLETGRLLDLIKFIVLSCKYKLSCTT